MRTQRFVYSQLRSMWQMLNLDLVYVHLTYIQIRAYAPALVVLYIRIGSSFQKESTQLHSAHLGS